jgi:CHAD domain-containing protein
MRDGPTHRQKTSEAAALDCGTAFQKMALDFVAAIKAHHSSACAGDAEAVHQIRVAITRLRAAVAFFRPIVADAEWLRLREEIAWLNDPLGAARDSDVVVEWARRKRYRAWAERMVGERLEQQQMRDHRRLVRSLRSNRTQRLLANMARWIRQGPWLERYKRSKDTETLRSYCAREFKRWHERLIRKGRKLRSLGASRRHWLRIRVKRFRYMLEALTQTVALWGRARLQHLHGPAKRLQRALGDLRDLKRLADLADGSPLPENGRRDKKRPPGYDRRKEKLLGTAIAAYRDLKHAEAC